jgi:hypothetical protein
VGLGKRGLGIAAGTLLFAGCASLVQQQSNKWVGQNVGSAVAAYGNPTSTSADNSDPAHPLLVRYWQSVRDETRQEFVQTGTRDAGSEIVGMTPESNGVGSVPIYQEVYEPVGYYRPVHYNCSLTLTTDQNNTIIRAKASGDGCGKAGLFNSQ